MRLFLPYGVWAGGPGSGCNPRAGRCGRLPGDRGRGYTAKQKQRLLDRFTTRTPPGLPKGVVREQGREHIQIEPAKKGAVRQQFLSPHGFHYTELKPGGARQGLGLKDPARGRSAYKGQFRQETQVRSESENRISTVLRAAKTGGPEGSGATLIVHRDFGRGRVTVQEFQHGEYGAIERMRQFQFRNSGRAAGFLNQRYGVRLKLGGVR